MGYPVLEDINFKYEMKKMDMAIARTMQHAILLVTMGEEPEKGGINQENLKKMQALFQNESIGRVLIADYTTKAEFVIPQIVTGVEALGRGNDLNKMDEFLAGVGQLLGPEVLGQYINYREYLDRRALALGIETNNLIKSEEQVQQEQQMAMMQQMGPDMAQQAAVAEGGEETEPETA